MLSIPIRLILSFAFLIISTRAFSQQDVDFHLNSKLLAGKKILKVKRDFYDPYLWVLAQNNRVYRVNSQTLVVDDYTATFSAYTNLQFVDIAGRSKDTVFIATNSTNVIHFKNGVIRLIGTADGIPGIVNSVGIAETPLYKTQKSTATLMIGTNNGFRLYDSNSETIAASSDNGNSRVYEATYRTEVYKDSSAATSNPEQDTVRYQPVIFVPGFDFTVASFLWEGGHNYGYNPNTALVVYDAINAYNEVFSNLFWGNSKGMFQNYANFSNTTNTYPGGHYLNNIRVNKITSIYGLTSFGSGNQFDYPRLVKQNLLIGTDTGFYFTSSIYTSSPNPLRTFSLFHDDELGSTRINDICVNVASTIAPVCEDGVWLAADDGLYYVKPDYGAHLSTQSVKAIRFENKPDSLSSFNLCAGDTIKAVINTSGYSGKNYQWYKNGVELLGQCSSSLAITTAGDYTAIVYDPCEGIHMNSNHLAVKVITGPVFSFNYPDKVQHCNNTPDTLKTDDNPAYRYRWYTNGVLNGNTTSQFIVTQSGKYKVELSACTNSWTTSKEIEVDLITLPVPSITMDKPVYCAGDMATITVNVPHDPGYDINWYQDGNMLSQYKNQTTIKTSQAGTYSVVLASTISNCTQSSQTKQLAFTPVPSFAFNYPDKLTYCDGTPVTLKASASAVYHYRWYKDNVLTGDTLSALNIVKGGSYKVEASACAGSWVPSKTVQVGFIKVPTPVIKPDKPAYCIGDNATLNVNIAVDTAYTINWYRDNNLMTADNNLTSITTATPGRYMVTVTSNQLSCSQSSTVQPVVFNSPPTVAIEKIVKTTLCDGQTIDLKVDYTGGSVQWSTGQSSNQIGVTTSGIYKATVTSVAGCIADTSVDVQFLPNPVFSIKDTSVCTFTRQTVILTAPPGFAAYSWNNGISAEQTYSVSSPQTVSLTVTDTNGCTATQQIVVASQCPDVHIPNTFTPNGDGMNDWWIIGGLENDETASVRVYNRYGNLLYESKGYASPWGGTYKGSKLPPGVYYYTISAKNNKQKFSGSVTIIY